MNNQSQLHNELTKKTFNWLSNKVTNRGLRWKQEFTLLNGIRPDAVAFGDLQEKQFKKMTDRLLDWNQINEKEKKICDNYKMKILEERDTNKRQELIDEKWNKIENIRDFYNVPENRFMFAFETKVSLSDYKNTFEDNNHTVTKINPFANFHFLVLPKSFLKTYNINFPTIYGILEQYGQGLRLLRKPLYQSIDELYFYKNAYNIMFKNDNSEPIF